MLIEKVNIWDRPALPCQGYKMILSYIAAPYNRFTDKVTSQDLLKAVAMLTMIIDHLGMYFFPQLTFLRAIGRSSAIIWLFFCGYNYKKKSVNFFFDKLFWAASLFSLLRYLIDGHIFCLNILFTIFISRLFLSFYSKIKVVHNLIYSGLWVISLVFFSYTNMIFEYGSLAILCSIWGYNYRHKIGDLKYQAFSILCFYLIGWVTKFHGFSLAVFLLTISATVYSITRFSSKFFDISGISKYIINIASRYSLYIYCLHLLAFILIKRLFL